MNKKLWWTVGALPLVAAPVAIVASCATTSTPAQAIAEVLHQENKVSFKSGKGTYSDAKITEFKNDPSKFLAEIDFNVDNKAQFKFEIAAFDGKSEDSKYLNFKVKVTDTKNESDTATSSNIKLAFTLETSTGGAEASEQVKAKVEAAQKAVDVDKTFKIKDNANLNGADFAMLSGLSKLQGSDLAKINPDLLDTLFSGVVKGDSNVTLSVAKFNVANATTKADQNITITMQLKYTDAKGDKPTSATTKDLVFKTKYNDAITQDNIFATWKIIVNQGWLTWSADSFAQDSVDANKFIEESTTNFKKLTAQFLPAGWTYKVGSWNADNTQDSGKKTTVTFALVATDTQSSKEYTDPQTYTMEFKHTTK